MNNNIPMMIVQLVVTLIFILGLIYLSLKYGGTKLQNIQNGRYIKIIERVPVTKDNCLLVVKMGDKGYVITSAGGKIDILKELNEDELLKLQDTKSITQFTSMTDLYKNLKMKRKITNDDKK